MEGRLGTVRISPQVLATIARLTTLSVPGVVSMAHDLPRDVNRLLRGKGGREGVHIEIVDDAVSLDLYVVVDQKISLCQLGRKIQAQVSRAINDMVGMPVLAVNVHIEDIKRATAPE